MERAITDRARVASTGRQSGMTLIEILVAIVVLSVGLLGLAGLQLKGMQVNQGSIYRWEAAMLAADMADRIRADNAGQSNNYKSYLGPYAPGAPPTTSGLPAGTQAAMTDWANSLYLLPGASALVGPSSANAATGTLQIPITITWVDIRSQAGVGVSSTSAGYNKNDSYLVTLEF